MPNPRKPNELLKRQGTYRADRHGAPSLAAVAPVEPVELKPYERDALEIFDEVLAQGVHWLARTDGPALVILRDLLAERALLRPDAMAGNTEARKHLREVDKQVIGLLGQLGFDPASRSRLGLAEVKAKSALETLREKQANR